MDYSIGGDAIGTRGDNSGWHGYMWVFALVIIFLALVFLWGRRDNEGHRGGYGMEGLAPLLAAKAMDGHNGYNGSVSTLALDDRVWDNERDMMREFAQVRTEAKDNLFQLSRDQDKYFYEGQKTTMQGFHHSEVENLKGLSRIEQRIDQMERNMNEKENQNLRAEVSELRTMVGIRGLGLMPSYNPQYNHCFPQ